MKLTCERAVRRPKTRFGSCCGLCRMSIVHSSTDGKSLDVWQFLPLSPGDSLEPTYKITHRWAIGFKLDYEALTFYQAGFASVGRRLARWPDSRETGAFVAFVSLCTMVVQNQANVIVIWPRQYINIFYINITNAEPCWPIFLPTEILQHASIQIHGWKRLMQLTSELIIIVLLFLIYFSNSQTM
jgi:hypothetical protein